MSYNWELEEIRKAQRARGPATILAIGIANPSNCVYQDDFAEYYFRVTNSHHPQLKAKLKRICEKSTIKKRYFHLTEEMLRENTNIGSYDEPSLNALQDILVEEVPKLGEKEAPKAIKEWGRPKSEITHLIFCATSCVDMPGTDYQLVKLLGLSPSTKRFMFYHLGCHVGGTVPRLAKDLAENNVGARVLIVCSEISVVTICGPSEIHLDSLVGQALFGDDASSVIVGCNPDHSTERPLFHLVSASQTIILNSEGAIEGHLREIGLTFHLKENVPHLIANNKGKALEEAFEPIGINDWNSIFWVAHSGGPAILNEIEAKLKLKDDKLRATKHVLSEYGNMSCACLFFIMDEMRRRSIEEGKTTTGDGFKWGVLFGFGPGLTAECLVLHSAHINFTHN